MISKKHYKQIAEVIRAEVRTQTQEDTPATILVKHKALQAVAVALCDIFENDNPNFRRSTFLGACGMADN